MSGLFITGTDTGVGKTYVACLVIQALRSAGVRVAAYKPVCSGAEPDADGKPVWSDVELLSDASGRQIEPHRICPQTFAAALAPPAAADLEDATVDESLLRSGYEWLRKRYETVVVEGAGGLLSPLSESCSSADLAKEFNLPLIVVSADRLGMINQTLLTIESAAARGLQIAGVIVNRPRAERDGSEATNLSQLARSCDVPILGLLEFGGTDLLRPSGEAARIDFHALGDPRYSR
ncbi:MAG: dethiobiotin synthase [Planctomycetota bacterium]|nr:MAG: dethiobiotin synthase [Planctomycetota bacterium]REJ90225.1 MAG: dethiobiotin synthase [Planctomycetota bacterium]REK20827.1 MAG: dethiobiotin synthase [Planctomycetota bacterium]REK36054.1 MAG: dethiobiotin synthase [Planctomycetota bacterium]